MHFHDGTLLTSADVKATLDAVFEPKNATAGFRGTLETLDRVEAPEPLTVVVHWKQPYFLATWTLLGALPVLPAHALQGDFDTLPLHRAPIGTGPFRFVKWDAGTSLTYARNETYWGPRAHLDQVIFRFVKDDTAAVAAWERGEFDSDHPALARGVARLGVEPEAAGRVPARVLPGEHLRVARLQPAAPALRRRAGAAGPGAALPHGPGGDAPSISASSRPPPARTSPSSRSCDPSVTPLPFDPPAAKKLLAEAGWSDADGDGVLDKDGARFTFAFLAAAQSPKMAKLLPLYLDTLKAGGHRRAHRDGRRLGLHEPRARARLRRDGAELVVGRLGAGRLSDLPLLAGERGLELRGRTRTPRSIELLTEIRAEFDPSKRAALERRVHRLVYEDQAILFLGRRPALDAFKRHVRGLVAVPGLVRSERRVDRRLTCAATCSAGCC